MVSENWSNIGGYFRIPYIWLLALCVAYRDNQFFQELQILDYRDFQLKHNPSMSEQFSWSDFMKLMVKIRKFKSHVFNNGANVTVGDIHEGAVMNARTRYIGFINHHLDNDVAVHHIPTDIAHSNEHTWVVDTERFGEIDIRQHKHIIQNAASASSSSSSAGDAILSLDSNVPFTELQQYNNA